LLTLFLVFLFADFIGSGLAFVLERGQVRKREGFQLLWHICLQRFAYRQLLSLVILRTLKRAAEGRSLSWNKLERTATVRDIQSEMLAYTPMPAVNGRSKAA
jgi:hypothetical protein